MALTQSIRNKLSHLQLRKLASGFEQEAAVLMPIFEEEGKPHFLLTRRTEEVSTHKGQISFPGGMRHGIESLEETALRETCEEVGIRKDQIEVLGRFHDYLSITDWRVAPFAGHVGQPFAAVPQTSEVAEILKVPFAAFCDPSRLRVEQMYRLGRLVDVYFYSYENYEIWGLTARIIKDFLEELGLMDWA
jgi:8-oxo-dGTP pyrophosphatase MutT (NUDIX family)